LSNNGTAAQDIDTLSRYDPVKRLALVACLVHTARMRARDDLADLALVRLRGAVPLDLLQDPRGRLGNPYSREEYEKVTSAAAGELLNAPHAVAGRLVAPLLRGLGVGPRYVPCKACR
jgi:hypothetical protein